MRGLGLSFAPKPKHHERFAREYRHEPSEFPLTFALLRLRSQSVKSQHLSYSNNFQDHGMYTLTSTCPYIHMYIDLYSYKFLYM